MTNALLMQTSQDPSRLGPLPPGCRLLDAEELNQCGGFDNEGDPAEDETGIEDFEWFLDPEEYALFYELAIEGEVDEASWPTPEEYEMLIIGCESEDGTGTEDGGFLAPEEYEVFYELTVAGEVDEGSWPTPEEYEVLYIDFVAAIE